MSSFPEHLLEGYRAFTSQRLPTEQSRYRELSELGQSPEVMVIGCCDSRVSPEVIFDAGPGELFIVRNVANLVPPYAPDGAYHGTSAAIEFAVRILEVPQILVMGDGLCGGVRALLENTPTEASDFIAPWIDLAAMARARALARTDIS